MEEINREKNEGKTIALGSVSTLVLKRSVIKHIRKNSKHVLSRTLVGQDFAAISCNANEMSGAISKGEMPYGLDDFVAVANGSADYTMKPEMLGMTVTELAYIRAVNNLVCSFQEVCAIQVVLTIPEKCKEGIVRREMERIAEIADRDGVQILGGDTRATRAVSGVVCDITAWGKKTVDCKLKQKVRAGDYVMMLGYTGCLGASMVAAVKGEELKTRFSASYIKSNICPNEEYDIRRKSRAAINSGAIRLYDVSDCGLYRALSKAADRNNLGVSIEHSSIVIHQQTIEICEFFKLNPYEIQGTGAVLAVFPEDSMIDEICDNLRNQGLEAAVIGQFTAEKEKVVVSERMGMRRHITPPNGDPVYELICR